MKLLNLNKTAKKGFTLVEILLVVGFIALAGLGVYVVYSKVQEGQIANAEGRNLDVLRSGIKNLYASKTKYTGLTKDVVINGKIAPEGIIDVAANDLVNSFGGTIALATAPWGTTNGADRAFSITYPDVPQAICVKLISNAATSFDKIEAPAGNVLKNTEPGVAVVELDPANVALACSQGANGTQNIVFISK